MDSLLDAQVQMLTNQKASVLKTASIDGKTSTSSIVVEDSASWAQELDVFRQLASVNQPAYTDKYEVVDNLPDANSNLRILSISTTERLPIRNLKVFYQDQRAKVRRVEASYFEANSIYSGSRNLILEFQEFQGQLSLTRYAIKGGQKMVLGDSITYQVEVVIEYE